MAIIEFFCRVISSTPHTIRFVAVAITMTGLIWVLATVFPWDQIATLLGQLLTQVPQKP